jgi:hypothetical protein
MEIEVGKTGFLNHFDQSLERLFVFTATQCYNVLSDKL